MAQEGGRRRWWLRHSLRRFKQYVRKYDFTQSPSPHVQVYRKHPLARPLATDKIESFGYCIIDASFIVAFLTLTSPRERISPSLSPLIDNE